MAFIAVQNLERTFLEGDGEFSVRALSGVSFSMSEGEFTALVGPSGSGKTTLLNCLGALDAPTAGRVLLDGEDVTALKPDRRASFRLHRIGFVFQAFNLVPVLTARENVEYVLVLQGVEKNERRERVRAIFAEMAMEDLLDRFPNQISGGQQQRVAVARALVSNPSVVLADEPTANLDGKNAELLLDLMQGMNERRNTTFLFSTHDDRVMKRARRLLRMLDGHIAEDVCHPS